MTQAELGAVKERLADHIRFEQAGTCDRYCSVGLRHEAQSLVAEVERLRAALGAVSAVYGPGDYAHDTARAALDGQAVPS